jgi:uncharacterized protein (DUF885 family)
MALSLLTCALPINAMPTHSTAADTVTRLADEFVAEYKHRFPFTVMYTGLPLVVQSDIDINAPNELMGWRRFVHSIEVQLDRIPESKLIGRPQWITRAYLKQGIVEARANEICRTELWQSTEWYSRLRWIADAQPVKTPKDRLEAISRWRRLGGWIDQDAANLAQGLRRGYPGYRGGVEARIKQIDALLAAPAEAWPTAALAKRVNDPELTRQLDEVKRNDLVPAAERYRKFLQEVNLPASRASPSISSQPHGMECIRARLLSSTTVDMDPKATFEVLVARRQAERAHILELGRQAYGLADLSWEDLRVRLRADPRDKFRDAEEIRSTIEHVIDRARSALPKMVLTPATGDIVVSPVPEYLIESAPDGQFFPPSDDGTRPATFAYKGAPSSFHREVAESLTLHETIPGHYLQAAMLAQNHGTPLHSITRLVLVEGSREGWATYAEKWAAELGLYSSPFDEMGSFVNSVTPSAVADMGMQVMGWTVDQAGTYLHQESLFSTNNDERDWAADMASSPIYGSETYPIDALKYEAARTRAQDALGSRFDTREYHQMLLSEGALPIPALNSKVDRWIAAHR